MAVALTKLAKVTTALSGALTVVCAVAITALQVVAGLSDGTWESHRLSWLVGNLSAGQFTYKTANVTPHAIDWLLDVPVVTILAAAMLVHLLLYSLLVEFEKQIEPP